MGFDENLLEMIVHLVFEQVQRQPSVVLHFEISEPVHPRGHVQMSSGVDEYDREDFVERVQVDVWFDTQPVSVPVTLV